MGEVSRRRFLQGAVGAAGAVLLAACDAQGSGWTQLASPGAGANGATGTALPTTSSAPISPSPAPSGGRDSSFPPPFLVGTGHTAAENRARGSTGWSAPFGAPGGLEAYADPVSVATGGVMTLHVRAAAGVTAVDIAVYRLGWYASSGGRLVGRWRRMPVRSQPKPWRDPATGLVEARWASALAIVVPTTWASGIYVAVVSAGHARRWAPFVVREASPVAPILVVSAVATSHAYNLWGGASLYEINGAGAGARAGKVHRAYAVSLARPLASAAGSGTLFRWEYPFVRWVERAGFDVAYAADVDLELHPDTLAGRRLVVLVGKPEYWSVPMRRAAEAALAAGTNLAFLAADAVYWRVRLEAGGDGAGRTMVCYKSAPDDPLNRTNPGCCTARWRDMPVAQPESLLIGQQYAHICAASADFVVANPDHWVYEGTRLAAGDKLAGLVGPEYDSVDLSPQQPPGLVTLARSPVVARTGVQAGRKVIPGAPLHTATIYQAPSGASVFAAGTIQWSWGLDAWGTHTLGRVRTPVDARIRRITSNVLGSLGWPSGA